MNLHFVPNPPYNHPVLLVDVFSGSLIGMLLGAGAGEVWVVQGPKVARIVGEGGLLFGEHEGLPPEGFHYGTSLDAVQNLRLEGQRCVVMAPDLYEGIGKSPSIWLGYFRNARQALQVSQQQGITTLAAVAMPSAPNLGNTLAAGFLAKRLQQLAEPSPLNDSQVLATALLKAFPDPQEALFQSELGQQLFSMGRTEDIALASLISVETVVPQLTETRVLKALGHGLSQDRYAYCFRAS